MAYVNHGGVTYRESNCAMCTLAGILGTHTAEIARMLRATGQSDDHLATALGAGALEGNAQLQMILNKLIRFVKAAFLYKNIKVNGYQYGVPGIYKSPVDVGAYMKKKKSGSRFAVWGYQTGEMEGLGAHWNYATTIGPLKKIEYRDYQDDYSEGRGPASGPAFHAPYTDREDSRLYKSLLVLSFEGI